MNHNRFAICCLSVLLGANLVSKAQTSNSSISTGEISGREVNTITTAVPFLMICPDSRSGGMGEAGVAISPDANSIHWNASKLAFTDKKFGLSISYTPWLRKLVPDINLAYLSGYYQLKNNQVIGGSLRYFSLGNITFTDAGGATTGQFRPNEFALDVAYARKLSDYFSGGMALRYIYSNLTGGINVGGANTKPGQSVAADINAYYQNAEVEVGDKKSTVSAGLNISNIGAKIAYSDRPDASDFIPINLRLGAGWKIELDKYNTILFAGDLNKLMVPTPPKYAVNEDGSPVVDADGNFVILKGKDPNRGIVEGMFGSFNDAPGGFSEELREFNFSLGMEYWYDKQFAVRAGYFYEDKTKGNRKFFTLGAGLKYNVFGLDFAYLIPTEQRNPLENTLRFTLSFDFDGFKSQQTKTDE